MKSKVCFKFLKITSFILFIAFLMNGCGKSDETANKNSNRPNDHRTEPSPTPTPSPLGFQWTTDDCSTWKDPVNGNKIDYCIKANNEIDPAEITLYGFHGMGGNAKDLCEKIGANTQPFEKTKTISHVVCPSFGPHWVIQESDREASFYRFDTYIQKQYHASTHIKPVLYGESMGGFNVIKLSSSSQTSTLKFQKVGAACPAIFSRRLSWRGMFSFIPNSFFSGLDRETSISIIFDSPYFDSGVVYPKLLMMANQNDTVGVGQIQVSGYSFSTLGGIYQGAKDFQVELQKNGQNSRIQELPGGHCAGIPLAEMIEYLGTP